MWSTWNQLHVWFLITGTKARTFRDFRHFPLMLKCFHIKSVQLWYPATWQFTKTPAVFTKHLRKEFIDGLTICRGAGKTITHLLLALQSKIWQYSPQLNFVIPCVSSKLGQHGQLVSKPLTIVRLTAKTRYPFFLALLTKCFANDVLNFDSDAAY